MSAETIPPVRFHLSLNVSDLPAAVAFFEKVLGQPAAKHRADYAKFELDSPPLVFSLEPRSPANYGSLNHVGFRFADAQSLVDVQRRLEAAGIVTQREEGVECCYAKQTKFWVHDLDQRLWEFYILEGDLDHRGAGQSRDKMGLTDRETAPVQLGSALTGNAQTGSAAAVPPAAVVWEHRMGTPFVPAAADCDEVRLRGTFNVPVTEEQARQQLAVAFDSLRPGGSLLVHVLTAESPVEGELQLPGRASYVKHAPVRTELMQWLEESGFVDLQLVTFRSGACFEHDGQPLRETQIRALRPAVESEESCTIVFKGPCRELTDDDGTCWRRGLAARVPRSRWSQLQASPLGAMFVELPEVVPVSHCGI